MTKQELRQFLENEGILRGKDFTTTQSLLALVNTRINATPLKPSNIDLMGFGWDCLNTITKLNQIEKNEVNDENIDQALLEFLRIRNTLIENSAYDYFTFKHNPINQLCVRLVETLAKEEDDLLPLLLGRKLVKEYRVIGETLRDLTETVDKGKRKLNLNDYILSADKKSIIPFSWYSSNTDKTAPNLYYYHLDAQGQLLPLNNQDLENLEKLFGNESKDLFDQLKFYQTLSQSSDTFYGLFMNLINGLAAGATITNRELSVQTEANEFKAGDAAPVAIDRFFRVWIQIPAELKNPLLDLREYTYNRADNYSLTELEFNIAHPSVRECFLAIRGSLEADDPLLSQQLVIRNNLSLINCVDTYAKTLRSIVEKNTEKFQQSLNGQNFGQRDYQEVLETLLNKIGRNFTNHIKYPQNKKFAISPCIPRCQHVSGLPLTGPVQENPPVNSLDEIYFLIELYGETKAKDIVMKSSGFDRAFNPCSRLLLEAINTGNEFMMAFLISAGAGIAMELDTKSTFLHICVTQDWLYVLHLLLQRQESHADLLIQDFDEYTALHRALSANNLPLMANLLNFHTTKQLTQLSRGLPMFAHILLENNLALMSTVIGHLKLKVASRNKILKLPLLSNGLNALEICIDKNMTTVGSYLIDHYNPTSLYLIATDRVPMLHRAIKLKRKTLVNKMRDALVESQNVLALAMPDSNGNTPLHLAVLSMDIELVDIIKNIGSYDINLYKNDQNHTVLETALLKEFYPAVKVIVNAMINDDNIKPAQLEALIKIEVNQKSVLSMMQEKNDETLKMRLTQAGVKFAPELPSSLGKHGDETDDSTYNKRFKK